MRYFLLMTSAIPLGNMPSAAASTLSASRSSTILPFGRNAMTEEALVNILAGNPRLLVNGVFAESLVGRVDVDFHVDKLEARDTSFVQKSEEGSDILGPS